MKNSKSILFSALFLFLCFSSLAQTKCLVADYPLNGNAKDVYGSKHGTLYGTSPAKDRFGRAGYALWFNGTSDWVKLGTDADFKARTISLWFKADTFFGGGTYGHVFTTDNANLQYGGTGFTVDNSGGYNRLNYGVGTNVKRYTSLVKGTWYHAAVVVNASQLKVYINGQLFDTAGNNSFLHSLDGDPKAHLGASRKVDRFFKGSIDDLKIYDCGLSDAGIDSLYKTQMSCPVAFYELNGDAQDISGNNNHGTVYGASATTDRYGRANSALKFNGSSNWVKLGTDADLAERTISLWFQVDTFIGNGDFGLVFTTDNSNLQYGGTGLAVDNSGGTNRISGGVGANIHRSTNAKAGTWYHYAMSVGGGQIKYYLNGKLIDTASNNSFIHSNDGDNFAHLGCSRKNDRYFKGSIDDVMIYGCAMSGADIAKLAHTDTCKAYYTVLLDTTQKFKLFLINKSTSASGTSYLWDLGDSTYSTKRNPRHNFGSFGQYKVCLTVSNGLCSSTFCDTLGLDSSGKLYKQGLWEMIALDEGQSLGTFETIKSVMKVYPNPANDRITIELPAGLKGNVGFYNVQGQKVMEKKITASHSNFSIAHLPAGLYTLVLYDKNGVATFRLLKQ